MSSSGLRQLLQANPEIDWRVVDLSREALHSTLNWAQVPVSNALPLLAAYQRLVRILPPGKEGCALVLLEHGLHSAIQIASIPQHQFVRRWEELFPGDTDLALAVYRAAQRRRGVLLHRRMNDLQHNEPHYRTARFK